MKCFELIFVTGLAFGDEDTIKQGIEDVLCLRLRVRDCICFKRGSSDGWS